MKKIFNTILAGAVALAAISCTQEELVTFNPTDQVAPILDAPSSEAVVLTEDGTLAAFTFTPASYGVPAAISYTLYADVESSDFANEKVIGNAKSPAKAIEVKAKTINNLLISAEKEVGAEAPVYIRLKSEWMGESAAVAGGKYALYSNVVTLNAIPYEAEKEYAKVWLPGTANGWDHKTAENLFNFNEDDVLFEGVTDFGEDHAENAFKLTGAAAWDDATGNWGSKATAPEAASVQLENGINDNIAVYTKNRFYHFSFDKSSLVLTKDYSFDKVGIIGLNDDWNNDIEMTWHSAKQRFYADVEAASDTKFKFRLDGSWDTNWGGDLDKLTNGGADIPISAGQYRIYLNLNDLDGVTGEINADMYGKEEGGKEVEPEPAPTYKGWGIIGDFNSWGGDEPMTQDGNVWTGYVNITSTGTIKLRKDADWSAGDYGGTMKALGEPFDAVEKGDNITLDPGFYKIVLDLDALTITISDGTVWSLIGEFNSWSGDVDMVLTDGKWVSPSTSITAGKIKIRKNHDWAENRGGVMEAIGTAFPVTQGGDDIVIPEDGQYIVTYDPEEETILIESAGWGVVGTITDWGNSGIADLAMKEEGGWLVRKNVALSDTDEIKVRYQNDWTSNYGGRTAVGVPVKAEAGAGNFKPGAGVYDIYPDVDNEVIIIANAGEAISYWGVVGTINNWGNDGAKDFIMYDNDKGYLVHTGVALVQGDKIKLRKNSDWGTNRGGVWAVGEAITVTQGGADIECAAEGTYDIYFDEAADLLYIMPQGETPGGGSDDPDDPEVTYNDNIYLIGADTGWESNIAIPSVKDATGANTSVYQVFAYLTGEYKFKPNADNWDGDWEPGAESGSITDNGSGNFPAPNPGYYMITVDIKALTYSLTAITTIGVIGPAQEGSWDTDTDMTWDEESKTWTVTMELAADQFKFRANDDWDINWGGAGADPTPATVGEEMSTKMNGNNFSIAEAGKYTIVLNAQVDGMGTVKITKAE